MPLPEKFTFNRNKKFLADTSSAGVEIVAVSEPDVLLALTNDTPFPPREIALGRVALSAEANKDVTFKAPKGTVTFKAGASTSAGLGVYLEPARVVEALALDDADKLGVEFSGVPGTILTLLEWRYDLAGSVKGALALGAHAGIDFGVDGRRDGLFAVVRRFPANHGARSAVAETVNSWMLPSQIRSADELDPGTWLFAEADGRIGVELGTTFGYDFNWIHEAQLGGLGGDIGLRIQLNLAAKLGFTAEGRYAIVIARESDARRLRLQLFKLRKKGWSFSFNGGASVQADFTSLLPESFDDFVAAVFGVHGAQIVEVLGAIEKWTDPNTPLPELISGLGAENVKQLLGKITNTTITDTLSFAGAREKLAEFLSLFEALEHRVATILMRLVGENAGALDDLRDLARRVATVDEAGLRALLDERLADVTFFSSPAGRWLEAAAGDAILRVLNDAEAFRQLRRAAETTTRIIDGPAAIVLEKFNEYTTTIKTALMRLGDMISVAEFDLIDVLVKARIEAFLDEKLEFEKLEKVRKTIGLLLQKRDDFYAKALKALERKYALSIATSYQKTTSRTALLDVEFDFDASDPTAVADFLVLALGGDYDTVLVEQCDGVTLRTAELTHGIERQSFVEVSLPFAGTRRVDHINSVLAKVRAVDEDEGRLLVYDVAAEDVVTERSRRDSRLAVGLAVTSKVGSPRVHAVTSAAYVYSFKQATPAMRKAQLQYQIKPYVERYLPHAFPTDGFTASYDEWIADLDKAIDAIENNGTDQFGDTLISLQLSLPPESVAAWATAPPDRNDQLYAALLRALQSELKALIPFYFFQDPASFSNLARATALLVYAAVPPSSAIRQANGTLKLNAGTGPTWDLADPSQRSFMVGHGRTGKQLQAMLSLIHERLKSTPGYAYLAGHYNPATQVDDMIKAVRVQPSIPILKAEAANFNALVRAEIAIVKSAVKAGTELAAFLAASKPTEAIAALAKFGASATNAFNKQVAPVYGGGGVRPLGTILFAKAADIFASTGSGPMVPDAILEITVYRQGADFPPDGFPNVAPPRSGDVVIAQRLVELRPGG